MPERRDVGLTGPDPAVPGRARGHRPPPAAGKSGTVPAARNGTVPAARSRPGPAVPTGTSRPATRPAPGKAAPGGRARPVGAPAAAGMPARTLLPGPPPTRRSTGPVSRAERPRRTAVRPPQRRRRPASPARRLRVTMVLVLLVLTLYIGRLVQIQGFESATLAADALHERSLTVALPAVRGNIVDDRGQILATTVERWNIVVDQTQVRHYALPAVGRDQVLGAAGAAQRLAPLLGMNVAEATAKLTGNRRGAYLIKNILPAVWRKIARLKPPVPGIYGEQSVTRRYPNGQFGASLVGFVGKDGKPLSGIERAYATELSGRAGKLTYERSGDSAKVAIPTGLTDEVEPQDGDTVRLTLDVDLQWRTQQALAVEVAASKSESGTAVIMDARTGEVLALVSVPTFDSNNPGRSPAADRGNRGLLDVFEPGSTAKVVTASAAIEQGIATPATRLVVPDHLHRSTSMFHDDVTHPNWKLTFAGVLAKSSNIGTMMVGEKMPAATVGHYLQGFGFGRRTHVGLPESPGILAPVDSWSGTQRYTVMFGQGVSVTALQAVSVYQTLANDGLRIPPRLVAGTTGSDGVLHPAPRPAGIRVVSARTAQTVRSMLEGVVNQGGTGLKATIPGYRVAGKTGTAQAVDSTGHYRDGYYTASFIGMVPADAPRLVMGVFLQGPKNGHYGGQLAAPVFQEVMTYALQQRGIAPTGSKPPVVPVTWP